MKTLQLSIFVSLNAQLTQFSIVVNVLTHAQSTSSTLFPIVLAHALLHAIFQKYNRMMLISVLLQRGATKIVEIYHLHSSLTDNYKLVLRSVNSVVLRRRHAFLKVDQTVIVKVPVTIFQNNSTSLRIVSSTVSSLSMLRPTILHYRLR